MRNLLTESADHIAPTQDPRYHHQSPGGEHSSEMVWGPEFFPKCENPGTPTEMNSPTRYEDFVSAPQPKPLHDPHHGARLARKRQGKHKARKSIQPAGMLRRSERIKKKQFDRSEGGDNTSRISSGTPVTPTVDHALQLYERQLRLLEEQNGRRVEARSQGNSSQKN